MKDQTQPNSQKLINLIIKIQDKTQNCRVCVIGAGVAGLSSARYLKEEGISFTVLECTQYVGGTWRYDPRVGYDENGLVLHTSMYKHLRYVYKLVDIPLLGKGLLPCSPFLPI